MAPNRIMRGRALRRALLLALLTMALAVAAGCGESASAPVGDRDSDAEVLNEILARQRAAVAAYDQVLPSLRGANLDAAREFRAQEQEHVDATTKTLRGLDAESDPPAETIEARDLKTRMDAMEFLYELESATIDAELNAVARLTTGWPRPLVAAMAANQAQRLVLIRRALGALPLESIPTAFETGETAAPETIGK
jgi:hypothetical protein